ncbi:signal recognition particle subunit srp68 [Dimargaris cristalligena]|uniref:Signal recognition particle subunit SRP68 n=1 Tax=Dimargaris cristalligena TaxID=215637 RepID=A0A4P9ZUB0_9FUNG|nr:signal recognition particle subunit srp68 [Dimargaris cristalligena]RKP37186.1 hypothetical protein BJ085DRAFT_30415 [Dimargaris cristalligena]|eukprot:RKP37186.1 hypothetical protein BJ085DRAFT_30415 [Dimargaris cristalligena]
MDVDSTTPPSNEAVKPSSTLQPIISYVHDARTTNGLRQQDYIRYRRFCTKRLHSVRKSLHLAEVSKKATAPQAITADHVSDNSQCLLTLLLEAERAWSYAQELKESSNASGEPRQRYHHLRRLRKAIYYAQALLNGTSLLEQMPTLRLEAYAYFLNLHSLVQLAQGNWSVALDILTVTRHIFMHLGRSAGPQYLEQCHSFIDELDPQIRYCAYKLRLENSDGDWARFTRDFIQSKGQALWTSLDELCFVPLDHPSITTISSADSNAQNLRNVLQGEPKAVEAMETDTESTVGFNWFGVQCPLTGGANMNKALLAAMSATDNLLTTLSSSTTRPLSSADLPLSQTTLGAILVDLLAPLRLPGCSLSAWTQAMKLWATAVKLGERELSEAESARLKVASQSADRRLADLRAVLDWSRLGHALSSIYLAWTQIHAQLVGSPQPKGAFDIQQTLALRVLDNAELSVKRRNTALAPLVNQFNQIIESLQAILDLALVEGVPVLGRTARAVLLHTRAQRTLLVAGSYDNAGQFTEATALYDRALSYLIQCKSQLGGRPNANATATTTPADYQLGFQGLTFRSAEHSLDISPNTTDALVAQLAVIERLQSAINARKVQTHAMWYLAEGGDAPTEAKDDLTYQFRRALRLDESQPADHDHDNDRQRQRSQPIPLIDERSNGELAFIQPTVPSFTSPSKSTDKAPQPPTDVPYLVDFPPRFQPLAYKPMFFDLAGSHIDLPIDLVKKRAGKEESVLGGIKGLLGNFWGSGRQ